MKRLLPFLLILSVSLPLFAAPPADLLLRVDRRTPTDLTELRDAGLPVIHETLRSLFLEGNAEDLAALRQRGFQVQVLDRQVQQADFLAIGLRPDTDHPALRGLGTQVYAEANWVLFKVPRGLDLGRFADLSVFVTRLSHRPMLAPTPTPLRQSKNRATEFAGTDPMIQQMVGQVKAADVNKFWNDLTSNPPTGNRISTKQGCRDAATYCKNQFQSFKLPAEFQEYNAGYAPNVVATHAGAVNPERVYIVIGHLDDIIYFGSKAPGADDNASGSVTALEAAKVMSCYGFRNTVKFITCTGEEQGLNGSDYYSNDALARGEDIRGVLNFDMNGWQGDGIPSQENLDLSYNEPSKNLALLFAQCATDYGTGLNVDAFLCPDMSASDHYSFWRNGYKAVCGITDNEGYCGHDGNYPYYHKSSDTIANCGNKAFFMSTIKATVATLATLGEPFKITFAEAAVSVGQPARLLVADRDLNTNPSVAEAVQVEVWSNTEPTPEKIPLLEQGSNSMLFSGSVPTTNEPPQAGDGKISVVGGDTITARYIDALDCNGSTNVTYTATISVASVEVPGEALGLVVSRPDSVHLEWALLSGADRYDVAGGNLSALHAEKYFASATCLISDLAQNRWDDSRPGPAADDGFYYLVRGKNGAGSGSWGRGSDGTERELTGCP